MSLRGTVTSDHQLARLLQIGAVLEEVVEARAERHLETLTVEGAEPIAAVVDLLEEAAEESHEHRDRLLALIAELDVEATPYEEIERLVRERYARTEPEDFDDLLYDQLCNEETAYKFYDDLIAAIEASDAEFSIDRDRLLSVLREIKQEEADGVEDVAAVMEEVP